jgi:hypothetical protein
MGVGVGRVRVASAPAEYRRSRPGQSLSAVGAAGRAAGARPAAAARRADQQQAELSAPDSSGWRTSAEPYGPPRTETVGFGWPCQPPSASCGTSGHSASRQSMIGCLAAISDEETLSAPRGGARPLWRAAVARFRPGPINRRSPAVRSQPTPPRPGPCRAGASGACGPISRGRFRQSRSRCHGPCSRWGRPWSTLPGGAVVAWMTEHRWRAAHYFARRAEHISPPAGLAAPPVEC